MAEKGKQSKFEMVIGATDRFSGVFEKYNARMNVVSANMFRMKAAAAGLSRATGISRLSGAMADVNREAQSLWGKFSRLGSVLALPFGAAGGGVFALAKHTANAGDAAVKAAQRAGVGIKTWQEYAHAASLSDVSNEQLEKGFVKLQDSAIKAFKGDKTQASLLKLAGIDPKTARGEVKNADSLFLELADKVKALQDAGKGAEAVNLVKSMLGEEGTKLMPMLSGGANGLKEVRQEAHKLGLVFSEEDARASEEFNDGITRMLASLQGLGHTLGRELLPPLTKLMAKFTEWTSAQRGMMAGGFAEWVDGLDIDRIWAGVESGFASLSGLAARANDLARAFGGWENVLIAVAAFMSRGLLSSLLNFGFQGSSILFSLNKASFVLAYKGLAAVGDALWKIPKAGGLALAPIMAVSLAAFAIYKNWDGIVSYFQGLWQGVKDAFDAGWTNGILTVLWNFNPLRLILKGMNELTAYFTGFDLFETIGKKWREQLTAWMPDWVKEKLGMGGESAVAAAPSGSAAPLNMGASARSISETRSEHVERQENTVTLIPPDGWKLQAGGYGPGGGGTSMQTGQLMYP